METPVKPIAIGADDAAYDLKAAIVDHLKSQGIAIEDYGIDDRSSKIIYPDVALLVAEAITAGKDDFRILRGGKGVGRADTPHKSQWILGTSNHGPASHDSSPQTE